MRRPGELVPRASTPVRPLRGGPRPFSLPGVSSGVPPPPHGPRPSRHAAPTSLEGPPSPASTLVALTHFAFLRPQPQKRRCACSPPPPSAPRAKGNSQEKTQHFQVCLPHRYPRSVSHRHLPALCDHEACLESKRRASSRSHHSCRTPRLRRPCSGPSSGDLGPGSSSAADSHCQQIPLFPHQEPLHSGPLIPCDRLSLDFPAAFLPSHIPGLRFYCLHPGSLYLATVPDLRTAFHCLQRASQRTISFPLP